MELSTRYISSENRSTQGGSLGIKMLLRKRRENGLVITEALSSKFFVSTERKCAEVVCLEGMQCAHGASGSPPWPT